MEHYFVAKFTNKCVPHPVLTVEFSVWAHEISQGTYMLNLFKAYSQAEYFLIANVARPSDWFLTSLEELK